MQVWCRCITTIFNYFVVTNFFWMFVEGCYLHTAIVMTYSTERLRKWLFLFIGWCEGPGGPAGSSGERILLTGSLPFILGPRTGPHCHLPSPGQSEEAGALLHVDEGEANSPSKRTVHKWSSSSCLEWLIQRPLSLTSKEELASSTSLSKNLRKSHCPLISLTCLEGIAESGGGVGRGLGTGPPKVLDGLQLNDWKQCPSPLWCPDSVLYMRVS